jgi:precorrin-2 dehydrogenase/sirohydrochlorin ferrochelatase
MGAFAFPASLDLTGTRCVVIGVMPVREGKVEALLAGGATDVCVIAEEPASLLNVLAGHDRVSVEMRGWKEEDLDGAFLAVAHDPDAAERARIAAAARERHVLVNLVDDIEASDWAWPAVVRRGRLVLAAGTGGASPALARRVRQRLNDQYGEEWGELTEILADVRERTKESLPDLRERMRLWREALDLTEAETMVREGRGEELRQLLSARLVGKAPR